MPFNSSCDTLKALRLLPFEWKYPKLVQVPMISQEANESQCSDTSRFSKYVPAGIIQIQKRVQKQWPIMNVSVWDA